MPSRTPPIAAVLAIAVSLGALPSSARAEEPVFDVFVRDEVPGITHRLTSREGVLIATCVGNCTMQVPRGTYMLETSETDEVRYGKKKVVVGGPTVVEVRPGSKSAHTTGLTLGVVGSASLLVGAIGFMSTVCIEECRNPRPAWPWLLVMVAGIPLTAVGWSTFRRSFTKIVSEPVRSGEVTLRAAPTTGGGIVALSWSF